MDRLKSVVRKVVTRRRGEVKLTMDEPEGPSETVIKKGELKKGNTAADRKKLMKGKTVEENAGTTMDVREEIVDAAGRNGAGGGEGQKKRVRFWDDGTTKEDDKKAASEEFEKEVESSDDNKQSSAAYRSMIEYLAENYDEYHSLYGAEKKKMTLAMRNEYEKNGGDPDYFDNRKKHLIAAISLGKKPRNVSKLGAEEAWNLIMKKRAHNFATKSTVEQIIVNAVCF